MWNKCCGETSLFSKNQNWVYIWIKWTVIESKYIEIKNILIETEV